MENNVFELVVKPDGSIDAKYDENCFTRLKKKESTISFKPGKIESKNGKEILIKIVIPASENISSSIEQESNFISNYKLPSLPSVSQNDEEFNDASKWPSTKHLKTDNISDASSSEDDEEEERFRQLLSELNTFLENVYISSKKHKTKRKEKLSVSPGHCQKNAKNETQVYFNEAKADNSADYQKQDTTYIKCRDFPSSDLNVPTSFYGHLKSHFNSTYKNICSAFKGKCVSADYQKLKEHTTYIKGCDFPTCFVGDVKSHSNLTNRNICSDFRGESATTESNEDKLLETREELDALFKNALNFPHDKGKKKNKKKRL